jgi:GNAT superfamily N-acetyltransferase
VTSPTSEPAGGDVAGSLALRPAGASDWPLIWPFWRQIVAAGDTYCYDPAMSYEAGRELWFGSPPDQVWLVGDGQETVLGSYRLGPNKPGPGSHIASASYMVSEAARGRGVGRALVLHSLDQARAAGYRGLQFNAVAASNRYAVTLYLDLGFTVLGAVPGGFHHPAQGYVDLLIMFHPLESRR